MTMSKTIGQLEAELFKLRKELAESDYRIESMSLILQLDALTDNAHKRFREATQKILNGEWSDHIVHEQAYWRIRHTALVKVCGSRESMKSAVEDLTIQLTTGQILPAGTPTQVFMESMVLRVATDVLSALKDILSSTK